jgi:cyclic pyranopterin phosphate synthase
MNDPRYDPLKILRWNDRFQDAIAGREGKPVRATMDLTNLCNNQCSWCEPVKYREATIQSSKHTLGADVAMSVIKDLWEMGCQAMVFSGGGEPTLHKDFGAILWTAHNYGMKTQVITNGSQIERWNGPLYSYADEIRVSMDASCESEHIVIHRSKPGEFTKLLGSLASMSSMKKRPRMGLTYTLEPRNWEMNSVRRAIEISHATGIDYIQFRVESSLAGADLSPLLEAIDKAAKTCIHLKILAMGWRNTDVLNQREFDKCYSSMIVPIIGANGDVQACCDRRDIVFGNVNQQSFRDIWWSTAHRQIANQIEPKKCPRCLQCGFNKAVQSVIVRNDALVEFV